MVAVRGKMVVRNAVLIDRKKHMLTMKNKKSTLLQSTHSSYPYEIDKYNYTS
jgi:hypothetical protein